MWIKPLPADLKAQRVLTPENLNWEETADPSSSVSQTGLRPQECHRTGREEKETGNTFDISFFLSPVWAFV